MSEFRIEQIEIQLIGGRIYLTFRDVTQTQALDAGIHKRGRLYSHVTNSSLARIVKLINNPKLFRLHINKRGYCLYFIADRNHNRMWNTKMEI